MPNKLYTSEISIMTLTEIIPFLESEKSIERMLEYFFPDKIVERDLLAFMMWVKISLESTVFLWNVSAIVYKGLSGNRAEII